MSKFKSGDVVAVYHYKRGTGVVDIVYEDGTLLVNFDQRPTPHMNKDIVHQKQCRLLKKTKRKPFEMCVIVQPGGTVMMQPVPGINFSLFKKETFMRMREILPTKPRINNSLTGLTNAEIKEKLAKAWDNTCSIDGYDKAKVSTSFIEFCKEILGEK